MTVTRKPYGENFYIQTNTIYNKFLKMHCSLEEPTKIPWDNNVAVFKIWFFKITLGQIQRMLKDRGLELYVKPTYYRTSEGKLERLHND